MEGSGPEELPSLGETTPPDAVGGRSSASPHQRLMVVGLVAFVLGSVAGGLVSRLMFYDGGGPIRMAATTTTTLPTTTTTRRVQVPQECVEAVTTAERAFDVLNDGLSGLRRFDIQQLDKVLTDLRQLRPQFEGPLRACQEWFGREGEAAANGRD